jgi:hypothetical protein
VRVSGCVSGSACALDWLCVGLRVCVCGCVCRCMCSFFSVLATSSVCMNSIGFITAVFVNHLIHIPQ